MNILFVCTGNTCRSPMAEHLLKHRVAHVDVQSAGIYAIDNQHANEYAEQVMEEKGIQMNHRSQSVTEDLLRWADLVLTMTAQHKHSLMIEFPHYQEKYFTLKEYVSPADQSILEELTKAYKDLEKKRTSFIQKYEQKYSVNKLNERILDTFKDEIKHIQDLEKNIVDSNIADPFGGNLETYRQTLHELDKYITKLIKKIE
ncbi:MAG TPA: low molecular weight protein arginine phosphatase [Bacillota bacterium]|nr:low molecular weight protein arginine phosphatase [Bacillota bacterium]